MKTAIASVILSTVFVGCDDRSQKAKSTPSPTGAAVSTAAAEPTIRAPQTQTAAALAIPSDVEYSIIKSEVVPSRKRSLDIRINKIVSENVLKAIALKLKSDDPQTYERTFILYYLPDMVPGSGAWASTNFEPELTVRVLGFKNSQATRSSTSRPANQQVIGSWVDHAPGASSVITIYRQGGELFMDRRFQDGGSVQTKLIEKSSPLGRRFEKADDSESGDYYVLTAAGDLEIRDQTGLFATAKPNR
jgi:hypothetical protein